MRDRGDFPRFLVLNIVIYRDISNPLLIRCLFFDMAAPSSNTGRMDIPGADENSRAQHPTEGLIATQSTSNAVPQISGEGVAASKRRRNHRGGQRKKKNRRQSFATPNEEPEGGATGATGRPNRDHLQPPSTAKRPSFYRLGHSGRRNLSDTSLDSQALLDHR